MLVEDNASYREVVKNNLHDQFPCMDIIEAADSVEAFQKIDGYPPNLIFMDIQITRRKRPWANQEDKGCLS